MKKNRLALFSMRLSSMTMVAWSLGLGPAMAKAPTRSVPKDLNVVRSGATVSIQWRANADQLLGFSGMPQNPTEQERLLKLRTQFTRPHDLFHLAKPAKCENTTLELEGFSQRLDGSVPSERVSSTTPLGVTYTFTCKNPELLKGIKLRLLDTFPQIKKLTALVELREDDPAQAPVRFIQSFQTDDRPRLRLRVPKNRPGIIRRRPQPVFVD